LQHQYNPNEQVYVEQTTTAVGPNGETVTQTARGGGAFGMVNSLLGGGNKTGQHGGSSGGNPLLNMGMQMLSGKQSGSHGSTGQSSGGASGLMSMVYFIIIDT